MSVPGQRGGRGGPPVSHPRGTGPPVFARGGAGPPVSARGGAGPPVSARGGAGPPVSARGGAGPPVSARGGAGPPVLPRGGAAPTGGVAPPMRGAVRGGPVGAGTRGGRGARGGLVRGRGKGIEYGDHGPKSTGPKVPQDDESDLSVEYDPLTSEILYVYSERLARKDFSTDTMAIKDFEGLVQSAVIFPRMESLTFEEVVEELLEGLWNVAESERLQIQKMAEGMIMGSDDEEDEDDTEKTTTVQDQVKQPEAEANVNTSARPANVQQQFCQQEVNRPRDRTTLLQGSQPDVLLSPEDGQSHYVESNYKASICPDEHGVFEDLSWMTTDHYVHCPQGQPFVREPHRHKPFPHHRGQRRVQSYTTDEFYGNSDQNITHDESDHETTDHMDNAEVPLRLDTDRECFITVRPLNQLYPTFAPKVRQQSSATSWPGHVGQLSPATYHGPQGQTDRVDVSRLSTQGQGRTDRDDVSRLSTQGQGQTDRYDVSRLSTQGQGHTPTFTSNETRSTYSVSSQQKSVTSDHESLTSQGYVHSTRQTPSSHVTPFYLHGQTLPFESLPCHPGHTGSSVVSPSSVHVTVSNPSTTNRECQREVDRTAHEKHVTFHLEELRGDPWEVPGPAILEDNMEYIHIRRPLDKNSNKMGDQTGKENEEDDDDESSSSDESVQIEIDQEFTVDLAISTIFTSHLGTNPVKVLQGTSFNDYHGITYDDKWIVVLCELSSVRRRHIAVARMKQNMYLMPTCQDAKFLVLVLANINEKGLKSAMETGRYFATILTSIEFRKQFSTANTVALIRKALVQEVQQLVARQKIEAQREVILLTEQTVVSSFSFRDKFCPPLAGIRADLARRLPCYLSDFSDGIRGYKTKRKVFAAVLSQYFATILTIIALGGTLSDTTNQRVGPKNLVFAQCLASVLFGIVGGHPVIIIQCSAPLVLYAKVITKTASELNLDFPLLYFLTGIFCCIQLFLFSIFNLVNIMSLVTRSLEESLDVFVSFTLVTDVLKAISSDFSQNYEAPACQGITHLAPDCRRDSSLLNLFVILFTLYISLTFHKFGSRSLLDANKREILQDYAIVISVILSTFVGSVIFQAVYLYPFTYSIEETILEIPALTEMTPTSIGIALLLSVPLALLIFTDHSINAVVVNNPSNKLYKGTAYHLDLLALSFINLILSIFVLPMAAGAHPNTPMHITEVADIENRVEQGVSISTLVRMRETRITNIMVGILTGLSIFLLPLPLSYIPKSVLDGLLLFLAITSLNGNELVERLMLLLREQSSYPANHMIRKLPLMVIHKFSALQVLQLIVTAIFGYADIIYMQMMFPIVLMMIFPIRHVLIPRIFNAKELLLLDGGRH